MPRHAPDPFDAQRIAPPTDETRPAFINGMRFMAGALHRLRRDSDEFNPTNAHRDQPLAEMDEDSLAQYVLDLYARLIEQQGAA